MPYRTLFFDLDDTLYPPSTGIWELIGDRIDLFIETRLKLEVEKTHPLRKRLFETYGTTLLGLVAEFGLDREDYLSFVHDVPVENLLKRDERLRSLLLKTPYRLIVFTNADRNYARRVLRALGLEDCFSLVIDILDMWPNCKPQEAAFRRAFTLVGEASASESILIDDTPANLETASRIGMFSILVGSKSVNGSFDQHISSIHDFPEALPDGKE
jgi:putative hydrolase of the HAD superfamily